MSNTVDYLIEFVTEAVSKFKLPDETQKQPKKLIGEAIQLILNREEEQIGHKAFIVISSFQ